MQREQRYTIRIEIVAVDEAQSNDDFTVLGELHDVNTVQCPRSNLAEVERIAFSLWNVADEEMRELPAQRLDPPPPPYRILGVPSMEGLGGAQ